MKPVSIEYVDVVVDDLLMEIRDLTERLEILESIVIGGASMEDYLAYRCGVAFSTADDEL